MNVSAKDTYGYPITNRKLPISSDLVAELDAMEDEYGTYLDWSCPQDPSPWTAEQKLDFLTRANVAYEKLKDELGEEYEITNEVAGSVGMG